MHQTTTPYTPQQNGIAERKNRTLKDMVNSMLNSSGLPHYMWGKALLTANTILNRNLIRKHQSLLMSCGKENYLPIKSRKCEGVLQRCKFCYLNEQNSYQRQLIVSSLDMLQIVQHIDS